MRLNAEVQRMQSSAEGGRYVAPTELDVLCGRACNKYVVPTALGGGRSPEAALGDGDSWGLR